MPQIYWNEIQAALAMLECDISPAGLHGQLAALACREKQPPTDFGLSTSAEDEASWAVVKAAFEHVARQLASADLEFEPLLPDDEQVLWRRLEGLAEWAECFAFGLSLGGGFDPARLSPEGKECLEHLLDISRLNPDDDEAQGAEADEAFTELVEFLRIAVMTLYVELRTLDASSRSTLH